MPLRPQLPAGLNLSRRVTTPVKLPKMTFPIGEGYPDQDSEGAEPAAAPGQVAPGQVAPGPAMAGPGSDASRARLALFQPMAAAPAYEQPAPAYEQAAPAYEQAAPAYEQAAPAYEQPAPVYEQPAPMHEQRPPVYERAPQHRTPQQRTPAIPTVPAAQAHQIIIYGRAGCQASIAAIQDLIDREISFTYYDVGRDARAMAHLQAICGDAPMVPVIIQIGFGGV